MSQDHLVVRGAREHNLQNVSVTIPRDQLTVITGLSGSGSLSAASSSAAAAGTPEVLYERLFAR